MKSIIHDWDDEQSRAILINCRKAVPSDGVLLLVELSLGGETFRRSENFSTSPCSP